MYTDNYIAGFACVSDECHVELERAGIGSPSLEISNGQHSKPLSMSQEMLMLCYHSGQVPESAWRQHLEDDPVLKAHLTLRWSSNSDPKPGKAG
ncbi:hypothetical protein ACCS93_29650 [Rhizobium ruizarguesonis]